MPHLLKVCTGSRVWELEIAFVEKEESRKQAKLQNLYVNKANRKLLSYTDIT